MLFATYTTMAIARMCCVCWSWSTGSGAKKTPIPLCPEILRQSWFNMDVQTVLIFRIGLVDPQLRKRFGRKVLQSVSWQASKPYQDGNVRTVVLQIWIPNCPHISNLSGARHTYCNLCAQGCYTKLCIPCTMPGGNARTVVVYTWTHSGPLDSVPSGYSFIHNA